MSVELRVVNQDLLEVEADVLAVKHAQCFHSSDGLVADRLAANNISKRTLESAVDEARFTPSNGALVARSVLFLGTVPLSSFGYHDVRRFAGRALEVLPVGTTSLALTLHGANCGLDEGEVALALAGGLIDAIQKGSAPRSLVKVIIVEKREARARRVQQTLLARLAQMSGVAALNGAFEVSRPSGTTILLSPSLPTHGTSSMEKPHAFVAMPFAPEFEDIFHYGLQTPIHGAGLLCERVDASVFEGLIIQRILSRISSARVLVAELTSANPNVYLEVGYAWALKVPTILVAKSPDELRFDVKGHRCLMYGGRIRELEKLVAAELASLGFSSR
jgi:hypothetical protein